MIVRQAISVSGQATRRQGTDRQEAGCSLSEGRVGWCFSASLASIQLAGLSQMDATWGIGCDSSGHVTPRRNDCNDFPPKSAAGTRPVAAW